MDRRELLKAFVAIPVASGSNFSVGSGFSRTEAAAAQAAPDTLRFFPGFKTFDVKTTGAVIHGVAGGSGPPILLLHGAPQTHVTWRLVAPALAKTHTVIVPDLRGYGDSSKPADGESHANYSKRAMALDMVEVMKSLGFDRFPLIGQDRGGRVGHRLALDHPDKVSHLAVLDIVPTLYHYTHVTLEFAQAYPHWFSYLRAAPAPENDLKAQDEAQAARATTDVQKEYMRAYTRPENLHGMCEDYRASASIDLKHDEADLSRKIACPVLALWSTRGPIGRLFDVLTIWKDRGSKVTGKGLDGGHYLQEDLPEQVTTEIHSLLRT